MLFFDDEGMLADIEIEDLDNKNEESNLVERVLQDVIASEKTIGGAEIMVHGKKTTAYYFAADFSGPNEEYPQWTLYSIKDILRLMTSYIEFWANPTRYMSDELDVRPYRYRLSISLMYNEETDGCDPIAQYHTIL